MANTLRRGNLVIPFEFWSWNQAFFSSLSTVDFHATNRLLSSNASEKPQLLELHTSKSYTSLCYKITMIVAYRSVPLPCNTLGAKQFSPSLTQRFSKRHDSTQKRMHETFLLCPASNFVLPKKLHINQFCCQQSLTCNTMKWSFAFDETECCPLWTFHTRADWKVENIVSLGGYM